MDRPKVPIGQLSRPPRPDIEIAITLRHMGKLRKMPSNRLSAIPKSTVNANFGLRGLFRQSLSDGRFRFFNLKPKPEAQIVSSNDDLQATETVLRGAACGG